MSGSAGLYECSFGGKDAGTESVKVVTRAQAKSGKPVELVITPGEASDKIKAARVPGQYTGTIPLMFKTEVE
ncbi:hypothetical protein [Burkholderia cenocepacia]|uniref:Uncharacterized protein n=1 Tax=Burkholderia cenocepacia TaxID=95486 RepID=A0A3Q9FAB8_9BURK|nr:hypothetical protein [Burkholderia cenocepacia]AZQ53136.1 hypothetical protein D5R55_19310 [Burkholderia cenocepacia]